jgi:hypothetical protein
MTIGHARRLACYGNIGKKRDSQTSPNCRTVDCRDYRLIAIDYIVNKVLRFFPRRHAGSRTIKNFLDHPEVASGREGLAGTRNNDSIDLLIIVYRTPDVGNLSMGLGIN